MARLARTACATALALIAAAPVSPLSAQPPFISVTFPEPGSVVNTGTIVAGAVSEEVPPELVESVGFEYLPPGGAAWVPIEGPAPTSIVSHGALWAARDLPGGSYLLRARLAVAVRALGEAAPILERFDSAPVPVSVNEQPEAIAEARSVSSDTMREIVVLFDGTNSFDTDGTIAQYRWTFDHDGTTLHGAVVQKPFEPGDYPMALTVTDEDGGESTHHVILTTFQDGSTTTKGKERCGCKKMTVTSSGKIDGPQRWQTATSGIPKGHKDDLGPYNDGQSGDMLDMKRSTFVVKCRFEVIAELTGQSLPALCAEGQAIQVTATAGGEPSLYDDPYPNNTGWRRDPAITSDPRYDSSKGADDPYTDDDRKGAKERGQCPTGGSAWCDDDYHGGATTGGTGKPKGTPPNEYKRYDGQKRILWIDAPGFPALERKLVVKGGARFDANFHAIVSGPDGTCDCTWSVVIEIDRTGKVLQNAVTNVVCNP